MGQQCAVWRNEFETLRALYTESDRGSGKVLMINGPIGSGSAMLLQRFAEWVTDQGALVLNATCSRAERTLMLGVISQLFHSTTLPPEATAMASQLLGDDLMDAETAESEPVTIRQVHARLIHNLATTLLDLAEDRTVVIGIDDLQYADGASLQTLLYLQRRLRSARIMLVLNEWTPPRPTHPLFDAELFRQPHCRRLRLELLTRDQVTGMVRERLGDTNTEPLVDQALAITGGNSFLLNGLLEDTLAAMPDRNPADPVAPVTGPGFAQAVLTCLHAWEHSLVRVARAAAVLGPNSSARRLARLLRVDAETVNEALCVLGDAGLMNEARFRHDTLREAVLDGTSPNQRTTLNVRAARMLQHEGAESTVVASHLVAAGPVKDGPWMVHVLCSAAEQALVDDKVQEAIECLKLAHLACEDDGRRAVIAVKLAHIEWRVNPSAAAQHLTTLRLAFDTGALRDTDVPAVVSYLLWHGRFEEATDLLGRWKDTSAEARAQLTAELRWVYPSLLLSHPGLLPAHPVDRKPTDSFTDQPLDTAAAALDAALSDGKDDLALRGAQQVLQGCRLGDTTVRPVSVALVALVVADRLDEATRWCSILSQEAGARGATTWQAQLEATAATIAYRRGDLAEAEKLAAASMATMSPQSWGTSIGAPLSILLLALTGLGKHAEAEAILRRAVPQSMFETSWGLAYLYARGCYHLATDRAYMALSDFFACGEKLLQWQMDFPRLIPWRTAAAEALLALGKREQAEELARQQLKLVGNSSSRVRGVTLRVLASVCDVQARPAILRDSTELLRQVGDKLQLAHGHNALSRAYQELGDFGKAKHMAERAAELMELCGTRQAPPKNRGPQDQEVRELPSATPRDVDCFTVLSNAERRVAGLAALGHTNREISRKLFITVSTVEQHLTRVYRKLNVNRRSHLPTELSLNIPDPA